MTANSEAFKRLYDIVVRLRAPNGCPWDRDQTPESLRADLIEETYECIEAIDEKDPVHIKEELGDIFLLVTMISYMHEEKKQFSVAEVLDGITDKLIRRHPHVFNGLNVKDSAEVLDHWERIKVEQEGRKPKDSILDEVSQVFPPLDRAYKLQKKAAKAGFDWPDMDGVLEKIREELDEVKIAAENYINSNTEVFLEDLEGELGDLLFSAVNLCRFLKVDASVALQRTNAKFVKRFKYVEREMKRSGQRMTKANLELMDKYWNDAKLKNCSEKEV
ncbi:nucleoside triphosphate pyrophosphohydrolase [Treponema sp. OttesenSCG-928-L16]|nr:nucleoside triphosphate pyrophosphohydrolase [Treponema sp. OttesenSCG-928-L16]